MFIRLPSKAQDLTRRRFGRLVALGPVQIRRYTGTTQVMWLCECDCGKETQVSAGNLRVGQTQSCGCMKGRWCSEVNTKHGFASGDKAKRPPEYRIWCHLNDRCRNPNNKRFGDYGGRGIGVSLEWQESFEKFYADVGLRPSKAHTIDRINNDGNYEPGNCRWATQSEQNRDRRTSRRLTVDGRTRPIKEWADMLGMKYTTLLNRISLGWSDEDAVRRPLEPRSNGAGRVLNTRKRRQAKRRATPPWLTEKHKKKMRAMAVEAKRLGLTVDHIQPLQGRLAWGLHVPWNLRLATREANMSKGNR